MKRRQKKYFEQEQGAPKPITVNIEKVVSFSEVDAMAIVWHGRYLQFFEMASEKLAKSIGLSYRNYADNDLRAPFVQMHLDYHRPLLLEEKLIVSATLFWTDAAKLNIEYKIIKEDGSLGASGYSVQMFVSGVDNQPFLVNPPLLDDIKEKWQNGDFNELS